MNSVSNKTNSFNELNDIKSLLSNNISSLSSNSETIKKHLLKSISLNNDFSSLFKSEITSVYSQISEEIVAIDTNLFITDFYQITQVILQEVIKKFKNSKLEEIINEVLSKNFEILNEYFKDCMTRIETKKISSSEVLNNSINNVFNFVQKNISSTNSSFNELIKDNEKQKNLLLTQMNSINELIDKKNDFNLKDHDTKYLNIVNQNSLQTGINNNQSTNNTINHTLDKPVINIAGFIYDDEFVSLINKLSSTMKEFFKQSRNSFYEAKLSNEKMLDHLYSMKKTLQDSLSNINNLVSYSNKSQINAQNSQKEKGIKEKFSVIEDKIKHLNEIRTTLSNNVKDIEGFCFKLFEEAKVIFKEMKLLRNFKMDQMSNKADSILNNKSATLNLNSISKSKGKNEMNLSTSTLGDNKINFKSMSLDKKENNRSNNFNNTDKNKNDIKALSKDFKDLKERLNNSLTKSINSESKKDALLEKNKKGTIDELIDINISLKNQVSSLKKELKDEMDKNKNLNHTLITIQSTKNSILKGKNLFNNNMNSLGLSSENFRLNNLSTKSKPPQYSNKLSNSLDKHPKNVLNVNQQTTLNTTSNKSKNLFNNSYSLGKFNNSEKLLNSDSINKEDTINVNSSNFEKNVSIISKLATNK